MLPTNTIRIQQIGSGGQFSVRLKSTGKLGLYNDVAGTQIGSDSALTVVAGTKYRTQLKGVIGTGATDGAELRAKQDGPDSIYPEEIVATTSSISVTDTQPTVVGCGVIDAPGNGMTLRFDDVALNDSTGTQEQSWCGEGRVVVSRANSRISTDTAWTTCTGSSAAADIIAAISALPPIGQADSTSHSVHHQARCIVSGASLPILHVGTTGYAALGIGGNMSIQTDGANVQSFGTTTAQQIATRFFLEGTLTHIGKSWSRTGTPTDDIILEIQSDSGGVPSGTVLATATIPNVNLPGYVKAALDVPVPSTYTTPLWVVCKRSGALSDTTYWRGSFSPTPPISSAYQEGASTFHNGTSWGVVTESIGMAYDFFVAQGLAPVALVQAIVCHGEGVATGTKTGTAQLQAQPFSSTIPAFTAGVGGSDPAEAGPVGTYPAAWRWFIGPPVYKPQVYSLYYGPVIRLYKTDTGTRALDVCFIGAMIEWRPVEAGWRQVTKTADSTLHWVKQAPHTMTMARSNETEVTATSGDFFITPDPLPDDGAHATLSTITTATLQAGYTGW